jgi:hypothetical protein
MPASRGKRLLAQEDGERFHRGERVRSAGPQPCPNILVGAEGFGHPRRYGGSLTVPPRSRRNAGRGVSTLFGTVREEGKTKLAHVFLSERAVFLPAAPARKAGVQGRGTRRPGINRRIRGLARGRLFMPDARTLDAGLSRGSLPSRERGTWLKAPVGRIRRRCGTWVPHGGVCPRRLGLGPGEPTPGLGPARVPHQNPLTEKDVSSSVRRRVNPLGVWVGVSRSANRNAVSALGSSSTETPLSS